MVGRLSDEGRKTTAFVGFSNTGAKVLTHRANHQKQGTKAQLCQSKRAKVEAGEGYEIGYVAAPSQLLSIPNLLFDFEQDLPILRFSQRYQRAPSI